MTISKTCQREIRREKMLALARSAMKARFVVLRTLGRTEAPSPESLYGLHAEDVLELYAHKIGYGPGLWFRLKDGRVVDALGKRSARDSGRYVLKRLPNAAADERIPVMAANSNRNVGPQHRDALRALKILG